MDNQHTSGLVGESIAIPISPTSSASTLRAGRRARGTTTTSGEDRMPLGRACQRVSPGALDEQAGQHQRSGGEAVLAWVAALDGSAKVSAMRRTHYDVLMISPLADRRLMTVVYRHLAKRYHPDLDPSPEAAARMAELNDAYALLSDPARRAAYDEQLGLSAPTPGASGRSPRPHDPGGPTRGTGMPAGEAGEARSEEAAAAHLGEAAAAHFGEAGPPPLNPAPAGPTLTFGRYRGWSLNQVARYDHDYLEWLSRTTMGRTYRRELDGLLRRS